ncbi:BACON domain-containing protein [Streptomyces hesseae]|uniref:Sigma-70 family RNA polymerase sigma factor n=1 Tax=Streptomyces hesseae TaxID=3075519 RepID=A0ABU2SW95_9ACTN|nr:sigma-70 family RNA polymerase sigma factor [Streptomyces sp. DSM 40473]MDT0453268.1 sigma-70 family RNA polymerase sigma factor [Streptomyces sp. DSM 40473]
MMTSRPEPPTHATGAHRAPSSAPRAAQPQVVESTTEHTEHAEEGPAEGLQNSPHLDGLFTYCLSVLCDHGSAVAALGETLALAERRADRAPAAEEAHRAWLYALARWECLRRLAERGPGDPPPVPDAGARAELALLAWPEAAGTTAEQREALELAVRHGLAPHEVAAVLRLDLDAARVLLSSAACEVERTRTALAVVESGRCPVVTRFVGDREVLLGAALRRELVRHVDECADCRRTAERAVAGEPWPGTAVSPAAALPVLRAPRAAAHAAMRRALDARPPRRRASGQRAGAPRFDRGGFPLTPKDRAARRSRLRSRAVTTTVVATVVAAPILALWAAYRGTPLGEGTGAAPVSATETDSLGGSPHEGLYEGTYADPYGATAPAGPTRRVNGTPGHLGHRFPDVSVAVLGPDGSPTPATRSAGPTPPAAVAPRHTQAARPAGPGRLTVEAQPSGTATLITLTADGGEPVSWSMSAGAPWLRLSQPGGVLRPGQSVTVTVLVDHSREPTGPWSARVAIAPGGTVVTIEGCGTLRPTPTPTPSQSTYPPTTPPPTH